MSDILLQDVVCKLAPRLAYLRHEIIIAGPFGCLTVAASKNLLGGHAGESNLQKMQIAKVYGIPILADCNSHSYDELIRYVTDLLHSVRRSPQEIRSPAADADDFIEVEREVPRINYRE